MSYFGYMMGGRNIDEDVQNHLSRLTSTDSALRRDLSNLILGLKTDGLWSKIEILCVVHDVEADSLLNLRGTAIGPDSTKTGSPAFVADQGFTPDGTGTDYLELGRTETTATLYDLYDAHSFVYRRTDVSSDGDRLMALGRVTTPSVYQSAIYKFPGGTNIGFIIQSHVMTGVAGTIGFFICSISAIDDRIARVNDTTASDATSKAHILRTQTINIGSSYTGGNYAEDEIAAWGIGSQLTATELGLYENRIRTYMQARGADVF